MLESPPVPSLSRCGGARLNVLFLTRSLELGGAERQLATLAPALVRRGHAVEVATFYGGGPLESELARGGVAVVDLAKRGRYDVGAFVARLVRTIRARSPDVVHGYLVAPNLLATLARVVRSGTRVVWGVRASDMDLSRYGAFHEATFLAARRFSALADLVIANSESGRRFHVDRGYPADRTVVIPNGIDTDRFRPRPELRAMVRADLGLPPSAPVVGIVARLDPMKGHDVFLEAAARLRAIEPEVRYVVVGGGETDARDRLRARAAALGIADQVRFAGPREDVERVYAALDVATSASSFGEGFPNAVAEAMASGVPCVVTDVGDSARIVGSLGVVVRRDHPGALARGWSLALETAGTGGAGELRARVLREFSVGRLVERTESELLGVLARRP